MESRDNLVAIPQAGVGVSDEWMGWASGGGDGGGDGSDCVEENDANFRSKTPRLSDDRGGGSGRFGRCTVNRALSSLAGSAAA